MATYVGLIQFADQGIRNIKDTVKRGDAAIAEAQKMGMKIVEEFWTMGAYDAVVVFEAPDDETMSAFISNSCLWWRRRCGRRCGNVQIEARFQRWLFFCSTNPGALPQARGELRLWRATALAIQA